MRSRDFIKSIGGAVVGVAALIAGPSTAIKAYRYPAGNGTGVAGVATAVIGFRS
jgi:hypothetical protein